MAKEVAVFGHHMSKKSRDSAVALTETKHQIPENVQISLLNIIFPISN